MILKHGILLASMAFRSPFLVLSRHVPLISQALPRTKTLQRTVPKALFSTSNTKMSQSSEAFMKAVAERRSYYKLNKTSPLSDAAIQKLVEKTVALVPSSFNAQSTRVVLLLNDQHDAFWDIVGETLKKFAPDEKAAAKTAKKNQGFKDAYGTILFYEDSVPLDVLRETFALYRDKFGQWSEHTSAMHQFVLWTGLEAEGFGANLQHVSQIFLSTHYLEH
jgi:predicted oxidoreductase (fatty acid repression mutant protein)